MIGNGKAARRADAGWLPHLTRYLAIDGGAGAHLLAALEKYDPRLQEVVSPRHANLLLIIEPMSQKLAPVVREVAHALPRPAHVLIVALSDALLTSAADEGVVEALFPGAQRILLSSGEQVLAAMCDPAQWSVLSLTHRTSQEPTIQMPAKHEQELATELAVLSLGPIQPFTAGPLRLFLICDGEQVLSSQVEAGYAHRGIDHAMTRVNWQQGMQLARRLDPLAPIAGQLAYVRALEQLQGWQSPQLISTFRDAALATERVQNTLWWLVRFASILSEAHLLDRAYHLARLLAELTPQFWQQPPQAWIAPQGSSIPAQQRPPSSLVAFQHLANGIETLCQQVERDRGLALRTRGRGFLPTELLYERSISGPVLFASEQGAGDVQSRLLARLQAALHDIHTAAATLTITERVPNHPVSWDVPAGEADVTIEGPRGSIGLHVVSEGGVQPQHVAWQRPSAALLSLLPHILPGQKLADVEVIVASLDLAMMEADG